ncbi:MAG: hypothetical protein FD153_565 [Rhodospirillaceae bacterium]|nr:MAG: hypothetical protein FD153_565 [Rhodospirillaceae bacterium]
MGAPGGVSAHAPRSTRHQWVYLSGAVCPKRGTGAALVLPTVNAELMSLPLAEDRPRAPPAAHVIAVLDGAGRHQDGNRLMVPDNITPLAPATLCPGTELSREYLGILERKRPLPPPPEYRRGDP